MENQTISLHRVIRATPAKVFRAFSDPLAHATWLPPYGFICTVEHMDFKEGGTYHMTFINFSTGNGHSFGGTFLEIKPDEYIRYNDSFDDPDMPGEMTTTVWLREVPSGTDLKVVQEGVPAFIPADNCYLGWQDSLDKLIRLVEPQIPDGA